MEHYSFRSFTREERDQNPKTAGWDDVVQVSENTYLGFDYWRSDWDKDSRDSTHPNSQLLQRRFGLDRVLLLDKNFDCLAELVGKNLSLRNDAMEVLVAKTNKRLL